MATIGPVQLIGGIQLDPARGRPNGLLSALNMEERGGSLATRPGSAFVMQPVRGVDLFTSLGVSPADWSGQSVTYIGFTSIPQPDELIEIQIDTAGAETSETYLAVDFYGEDSAWHRIWAGPCSIVSGSFVAGSYITFFNPASLTAYLQFNCPYGWVNAIPATTPSTKYWLRLTRSSGTWASGVIPTLAGAGHLVASAKCLYPFHSRTGYKTLIVVTSENGDTPSGVPFLKDVDNPTIIHTITGGAFNPGIGFEFGAIYLPSTDELLVSYGGTGFTIDCLQWFVSTSAVLFTPDSGSSIEFTAYADIPVEAGLATGHIMAMFDGRIFMAGFQGDPLRLRWSAPNEFWRIWPSDNTAFLTSNGAGRIVALQELHGTLFVFTENSIYAAQLTDPLDGAESSLVLHLVEETGCAAGRSVVFADGQIAFLSFDGVRLFNGQTSALVSGDVERLFRSDTDTPFACTRKSGACGVWEQVKNQYRLFYPLSDSVENDTCLVVELDGRKRDKTCWIHGAQKIAAMSTSGSTGPIGQRKRGVRGTLAAWHAGRNAVLIADSYGSVFQMDNGDRDWSSPIEWTFKTHGVGMTKPERRVVTRVDLMVLRNHFATFSVGVIPDGDRARIDTKAITVQPDGLDTTVAVDSADLTGEVLLQLEDSFAPVTWRGRLKGRMHSVEVSSVADNHEAISVAAMEVDVSPDGAR